MILSVLSVVAAPLLGLTGCERGQHSFHSTDITGAEYARDFKLVGHDGRTYTLADFRGKAVAVFFGFAQCPDVCPTNMTEWAEVRRRLGPLGDKLQVLFITIDPERDTEAVLSAYVPAFDPSFIGLRGDDAQTAQTAKAFKVFFQKVPGQTPGSYTMEHTAGSYVYDQQGRIRLFVRHGQGLDALTEDVRWLLEHN